MKVTDSKPLYKAKAGDRTFLTLHELSTEFNGKKRPYFMVTRGEKIVSHYEKQPDAVIIVATYLQEGQPSRLVMISEFRPPIGRREISFPAGLIEPADLKDFSSIYSAAIQAAVREFYEETGLTLKVLEVSPKNLYSSSGMSNESSIIVIGTATGTPSTDHCESNEDIEVMLLSQDDIKRMIVENDDSLAFSKAAWPFLWAYRQIGL